MALLIRRPEQCEAPAMAALHISCWREAYREIVPDDLLAKADPARRTAVWLGALADPDRIVMAAYDGDIPVGFIMAGSPVETLFDAMDGHIAALYVATSHYRKGIGRRLLGEAARLWLSHGGTSLALGVLAANKRARAFYDASGGRLVSEGMYNWDGHDLPDAIYCFDDLGRLAAAIEKETRPTPCGGRVSIMPDDVSRSRRRL